MKTILVIDDDIGTLDTFREGLGLAGFDVLTAESGERGVDLALHADPDVVLTDLRLPDLSGLEVLRQVRASGKSTPFVIMTAFATTGSAVEAMRLGALDYVEKPIFLEHVVSIMEQAVGRPGTVATAGESHPHALERWADAIATVFNSSTDPKTFLGWSRLAAASPGTLRNWCRAAGLSPHRSLVFARLLRAVLRYHAYAERPENALDVVDMRTLAKLLEQSGTGWRLQSAAPTVEDFLHHQTLIDDVDGIQQVRRILAGRKLKLAPRPIS